MLIGGYKSYPEEEVNPLPLRPLTVLLGKNNSGKTAAARLPLLLLSAASSQAPSRGPLPLQLGSITYASKIQDLVYGYQPHGRFTLGLEFDSVNTKRLAWFMATVQLQQSFELGRGASISSFSTSEFKQQLDYTDLPAFGESRLPTGVRGYRGLLPEITIPQKRHAIEGLRTEIDRRLSNSSHLTAMRAPIQSIYEDRPAREGWDTTGAETPYLLNEDPILMAQVARWYHSFLEAPPMDIVNDGASFSLAMSGGTGASGSMASAGQGMQQALPVVARLLACANGYSGFQFLVFEEPELHLHPAAHGDIGDLAVQAVVQSPGSQVMIETHSENLVLRIRRRIAEGVLRPEDVQLLWFQQKAGRTTVRPIDVDDDGAVSDWPAGVFSEDLKEIRHITRARVR